MDTRVKPAYDERRALHRSQIDPDQRALRGLVANSVKRGVYALSGTVIVLCVTAFGMVYFAYPLAAGFALIGPFVAIGLYEISRRRESGEPVSIAAIWFAVRARSEIGWIAFVTLFFFVVSATTLPSLMRVKT
jgi:uncharacterized membrane protein